MTMLGGLQGAPAGEPREERQHVLAQRAIEAEVGVDTVRSAYLATGASIWTVVNALSGRGYVHLGHLEPTSNVGLVGSVVS